jgi:hypothetical protein
MARLYERETIFCAIILAVVAIRSVAPFLARHWVFSAAFAAGLALRLCTMLGFPPAIWFAGDSITYVSSALTHSPSPSRQSGYSLLLIALEPLHSFAVVTGVQHLMGLAMGAGIYAVARKRGLPRWGATLASVPVLLDAYEIQLEHEILPDTTFAFCVVAAVVLFSWWRTGDRPLWATAGAAGLLGLSAACWPVGLPLLIVLVAMLAITGAGWRAVTAAVLVGAVPLAMYLAWYDREHDRVAFNTASGDFLWSRTMTFANCAIIKPPPDERPLCPDQRAGHRMTASLWLWEKHTPLARLAARDGGRFSDTTNGRAGNFAKRAILAQPLGYAGAVLDGFAESFTWGRPLRPTPLMSERYQFSLATHDWDHRHGLRAQQIVEVQRAYTGGHLAFTRAVRPFSTIMIGYQRVMYLRGTMTGILLLIGLAGLARNWRAGGWRRRRDWGGPALLPWLAGLAILLVPEMTADFSLRYMVPAVPILSLAAALAFRSRAARPVAGRVPRPRVPVEMTRADVNSM